jgi:hypothetical protein
MSSSMMSLVRVQPNCTIVTIIFGIIGSPMGVIVSTPKPSSIVSVDIIIFRVSPLLRVTTVLG